VEKKHAEYIAKLRTADAVADYIRAVLDAGNRAGEQLQGFARERDLSVYVLNRWKAFLDGELKGHSPVYSPLVTLHAIPEADFAAKAAPAIDGLGQDAKKPVNPLVLKALIDAKPKTSKEAASAVAAVIAANPPPGTLSKEQAEVFKVWGGGGPIDIPASDFEKIVNRADRDKFRSLQKNVDAFNATSPVAPPRAMVLNDGPAFQPY